MKDKVAQRERTDALVGGARTFNEFVKEKASASNITPACVRSLPEIKEEWKQIKAQQMAEKKAEKAKTTEAKKAEKKATQKATKATAKSTVAVAKEKTAIKKVAKKSAVDTENIKMVLVEKAHKKSQAEKPPAEPKVKGRPKKYATPEEARRAKIEATKVLNKAKKAVSKAEKQGQQGQQGQPVYIPIRQRKNRTPAGDKIVEEMEREEMGAEDMSSRKKKARVKRVAKQRKENETMGMEDEDVPTKFDPDVYDAELKVYTAKTPKDLDGVLSALRRAEKKYDRLDKYNRQSYDHTLQVYANKRQQLTKMADERTRNLEMFKKAKSDAPRRRENEAMMAEDINRAKKTPKPKKVQINRKKIAEMTKGIEYRPEFPTGRGYDTDALKEFNNYGKIQDHLAHHLNTLSEEIDPKDLRDYIHFTKEKARLKSKLVGGLVRMIGGKLKSDSDSDSDSDDEMEGGESLGFFGNIKRAFNTSWNKPVQSDAERKALDFTLNYLEPVALAPLNILAPPVGRIGEAQRQLMKSKAGV